MSHADADVLIIGAGPAGSAAGVVLARSGRRVLLVDRCRFPRDKVCGDALIPDALAALDRLSLAPRVLPRAERRQRLRLYAPDRSHVSLDGEFACLPRQVLDDELRRAAVEAGATSAGPWTVAAPLSENGTITGARFLEPGGRGALEVRARVTLLATGAAAQPLEIFGVSSRRTASAMAARAYYQVEPEVARDVDHLLISFDRAIAPGYGWIFPGPDRVFNVGVGVFHDTPRRSHANSLRAIFDAFVTSFPPAAALLARAHAVTPLRGAPLRMGMTGARFSRPGLLVIGEAAGLTYSFSGEGIGKAMESGLLAAELVLEGLAVRSADPARLADLYAMRLTDRFATRFRAYRIAQDWLASPVIANLLAWRARTGRYARAQMEGLLSETTDPRDLFSATGLLRALIS